MTRRATNWTGLCRKRLLALSALLAYLAGAIGFPLPLSGRSGEGSAPIHACGCPAPERAARKCCCCCTSSDDSAAPGCCGAHAGKTEADAGKIEVVWVAGMSAWRCQGLQPLLGGAGPALKPPAPLDGTPNALPFLWFRGKSELPCRLVLPLPDPPPRSFLG